MNETLIERNRAAMRRFETCINTNDLSLVKELISEKAAFMSLSLRHRSWARKVT